MGTGRTPELILLSAFQDFGGDLLALVGHYIIVVNFKISISLDSPLVVRCATGFITMVLHQNITKISWLKILVVDLLRVDMYHFL